MSDTTLRNEERQYLIGKRNTFDWKEFITSKLGHQVIEIEPFHSTKIYGRKVGGKNNNAIV